MLFRNVTKSIAPKGRSYDSIRGSVGGQMAAIALGEHGRGAGTPLQDDAGNTLSRRRVSADVERVVDFHNTSVPLIRGWFQIRLT